MEEIALKDLCLKITDGAHHSPKEFPGGMPMASVKDMTDIGLDLSNCKTISKQDYDSLVKQNCQPQKGDVLLAKDGNTYLKYIFSCKQTLDVVLLSSIAILRPNQEIVSPQFLAYYLSAPNIKGGMANCVSGSAIPRIILKDFRNFKVSLPPLPIQQKIAAILSAYDDLIENNLKRIALLEKSARLLYEEWFVRLRFPGYEHSNIVDGVPEGWEKKPFSELADFVNGYPFKPADLGDDGLPVVKIPELRSGVTSNTPKNLGELIPEKYFIDNGSLLFSWSGTLLVNFWFGGTAILNQHLFHVIEYKSEHKSLLYFAIKHHMEEFLNLSVGATMKHIRKSALTDVKTMIPSDSIMGLFNNTVSRNLAQIGTLTITNHKLKQARDILLPKLINGEIAV